MFNIGAGEFIIIFIVLIIAVGPDRLPTMMKTVGKTMRTLRQASRDLRQSTGIDELMREDFDLYSPPRRPAPPGPAQVSREAAVLPANNPIANAALSATVLEDPTPAPTAADPSDNALPSDGPTTNQEVTGLPEPVHAPLEASLPSDAPVAAPEAPGAVGTLDHAEPAPATLRDAPKPRET